MGGWLTALLGKKEPQTPIKNPFVRISNLAKNNFRGIIGFIFPVVFMGVMFVKENNSQLVKTIHIIFAWYLLWQPVNVPVVGLLPLFAFPMLGVMISNDVCKCYFNSGAALLVLGGWVLMLWNNSGLDRRIILKILGSSKDSKLSSKWLLLKASLAAFVTCAFSNRLIATSELMHYVTAPLLTLKGIKSKEGEPDYNKLRCILANAIQTSGAIGSIAFVHSAYTTIGARMLYTYYTDSALSPDAFNFLNYSAFAIPTSIAIFLVNLAYYMFLLKVIAKGKLHTGTVDLIRNSFVKARGQLSKSMSLHEWMTFVALILCLGAYFGRWSYLLDMGWSGYKKNEYGNPGINDATVSAIFVVLLHTIPRSFGFLKYFRRGLPASELPRKPESSILFFKFVDKNTIYGYVFLIGGGVALAKGINDTGLSAEYSETFSFITDNDLTITLLMIVAVTAILSCIITGCGVLTILLPIFLNLQKATTGQSNWATNYYLGALAVGIGTSFGFTTPFLYTPAYFVKHTAKVPLLCQIKFAIGSVIISILVLWVMLAFFAPIVLEKGAALPVTTTTPAPA